MWKGACAEFAHGSRRTTGDRLGISLSTFRVFENEEPDWLFLLLLGWPVDKAGPEFTEILQPLPPGYWD